MSLLQYNCEIICMHSIIIWKMFNKYKFFLCEKCVLLLWKPPSGRLFQERRGVVSGEWGSRGTSFRSVKLQAAAQEVTTGTPLHWYRLHPAASVQVYEPLSNQTEPENRNSQLFGPGDSSTREPSWTSAVLKLTDYRAGRGEDLLAGSRYS